MFIVIFFLLSCFNFSYAQGLDPYDLPESSVDLGKADQDQFENQQDELDLYEEYKPKQQGGFVNTGFMFFPFYNRVDGETTAYGIDSMYYFRRSKEPPLSKPSYFRGAISAGKDSYTSIYVAHNNYWKQESNNIYGAVGFERRRALYYQPLTQDPMFLGDYRLSQTDLNVIYRQKFSKLSYIGIKFDLNNSQVSSASSNFYGLNDGLVSGLGLVWSSLEPGGLFSTLRSFDFELDNTFYLSYFGSDYNFGVHSIDIRENIFIANSHVLLLRFYGRFMSGEPPYFSLSSVGEMFRAYSTDRYRDRHFMGLNAEYRLSLVSVITLKGFFGVGYHSSKFSKFRLNSGLPCYGGGLSFVLNRELGINAGFEYLAGKDSRGVFFGVGENY